MWLDRFSNHPTPSASPPPGRPSLQQGRRPSYQGLGGPYRGGGYSPRSSSLNVSAKFNASTSSLNSPRLLPNGSALKQELVPPPDFSDPLAVLEDIVGKALEHKAERGRHGSIEQTVERPLGTAEDIDFGDISLRDFADQDLEIEGVTAGPPQTAEEYSKDKDTFEDLHKSILACDDVLKSVEVSLTNFQNDLGAVSSEIETLQNRSVALNTKLENRKVVERLLGPAVEEISVAPGAVRKIAEGPIDEEWVEALKLLEKRSRAIESKSKEAGQIRAVSDVKPMLDDLTKLAVERIRDYLVSQIKALRSPNINAQIIQQKGFLGFKDLFAFLAAYNAKLAEEIGHAYANTMRWYYLSHFTRYKQALEKIPLYTVDKSDAVGAEPSQRTSNVQHAPSPLTLSRRIDIVKGGHHSALPSHIAEDTKTPMYLETPFHAFSTALMANAVFEYAFLTNFFPNLAFSQVNALFMSIFAPVFALGDQLTRTLIESTYDCFGLLLCVRITQHQAFELQRCRCPVVDGYVNATNMLLWPRFQIAMDTHVESVKKATAGLPSATTRATNLLGAGGGGTESGSSGAGKGSTAPHTLTQRFGQLLQGILSLVSTPSSSESISESRSSAPSSTFTNAPPPNPSSTSTVLMDTTTPTTRSLDRLRAEFEAFLEKASRPLQPRERRDRFLGNNYGLVLAIIADAGAVGLAAEVRARFESLAAGVGGVV